MGDPLIHPPARVRSAPVAPPGTPSLATAPVPAPIAGAQADREFLVQANTRLHGLGAAERLAWARDHLPGPWVLSSSFGIQAAVMLHLACQVIPRIPVILIDTGYLFPETYRFVDTLAARLDLNLHVYGPPASAAWLEARHGRLWEGGLAGVERYNQLHKVEPMGRALRDLGAGTWFAGLRRAQSRTRQDLPLIDVKDGRFKVYPILDWTDREVYRYLKSHGLPYHPLWEQGYVSVGDWHSSAPLRPDMLAEETRFFGLKRECGLHE